MGNEFPTCLGFAMYMGKSLADVMAALNGALHGPIHIMIGGQWQENANNTLHGKWMTATSEMSFPDSLLLLSKVLWRSGYLREPAFCSTDTPTAECMTKCPDTYLEHLTSGEFLNRTGMEALMPFWASTIKEIAEAGLSKSDLVTMLCSTGFPGEMFTSAAPQDPTFWPLHGNAERFVQYLRVLDRMGKIDFDQTWGYTHSKHLPSATGLVCDWKDVAEGSLDLPVCTKSVCSGHAEEGTLPFDHLFTDQDKLYTNREFYKLLDPANNELPYAYDSLSYWDGCSGNSLMVEYNMLSSGVPPPGGDGSDHEISPM